jgi:hypothetical protein
VGDSGIIQKIFKGYILQHCLKNGVTSTECVTLEIYSKYLRDVLQLCVLNGVTGTQWVTLEINRTGQ